MRNDMQQKGFSRTQSGNVTVHSQKVAGHYICQKELYKNNSAPLKAKRKCHKNDFSVHSQVCGKIVNSTE